jgi:RNA polymerase sigma-70 factor (ECF subfamily)
MDRYRNLLLLLARRLLLGSRLRSRLSASDLVQDALLKAEENHDQLRGQSEGECIRWLQTILNNAWRDQLRRAKAGVRDIDLERSMEETVEGSSARLASWLAADQSSPSARAQREDQLLALADALAELADDEQDALVLRHVEGLSEAAVAEKLGRTLKAVTALLYRGRKKLRERLHEWQ